jgi:hypothetical protein
MSRRSEMQALVTNVLRSQRGSPTPEYIAQQVVSALLVQEAQLSLIALLPSERSALNNEITEEVNT